MQDGYSRRSGGISFRPDLLEFGTGVHFRPGKSHPCSSRLRFHPKSLPPKGGCCSFIPPALERCDRSEETAAGAIGAMTAPILAIRARQSFLVRNNLLQWGQLKACISGPDRRGRHNKTVIGAAAPFVVLRAAETAARNPAIMRKGYGCRGKDRRCGDEGSGSSSDHMTYHSKVAT